VSTSLGGPLTRWRYPALPARSFEYLDNVMEASTERDVSIFRLLTVVILASDAIVRKTDTQLGNARVDEDLSDCKYLIYTGAHSLLADV
jgi:hypothetical protein